MKGTIIACFSVLSMVGSVFLTASTSALPSCYIIDGKGDTIDLGFICQAQISAPQTENMPEANNTTPVETAPVTPENTTPATNQNTSTTPAPRTNTPTLNSP